MEPDEWQVCRLGDVLRLKRGYDLPSRLRRDGPFPIISSSGVTGRHAEAKVAGPGVVTGRYGTLGQVFYEEGDYWPLNTTLYVEDFKGTDPRFAFYLLQTLKLETRGVAAAVPGVNRNDLHQIEVRVPSPSVQRRIAAVLETYDRLLDNIERRLEILEEIAQRVYVRWFVEFRYPRDLISPAAAEVDQAPPSDWRRVRLAEVGELTIGGDWGSDVPAAPDWVNVACLRGVDLHALRLHGYADVVGRWVKRSSLEKRRIGETDVIVEGSGEGGRSLLASPLLEGLTGLPVIYSNFCKRLHFPSRPLARYVARMLNDLVATGAMKQYMSGTAIPNLNADALLDGVVFALPPEPLLAAYSDLCEPMDAFLLSGIQPVLRSARDLVLPRLMSGEVAAAGLWDANPAREP
jgi:type I restriction enzyme S subunit